MNPFSVALKDRPEPRTRRRKGNYVERLPRTPKKGEERDDPLHDRDNAFMSTMPGTIQVEEHHKPERDTGKMMVGKKGFEKQPQRRGAKMKSPPKGVGQVPRKGQKT